ncbi:ribosome biogenesis protein ytm1 [Toensbergia leucococca]|nr:ribosome biogenesis protein ytm1 [Toensbergia leucococca]
MASGAVHSTLTDSTPKTQVKLQLTTRQPDISLSENTGPILVSTHLRRYALSTLVNTLLHSEKPIPFEFLINGTFLRTSIDDYLTSNGISSETTLTVEYVRAIIPPLYLASFEHDDWVSSVDVLSSTSLAEQWAGSKGLRAPGQERILSGSYDGFLRVWNMSSDILATSPPADGAGQMSSVKAVKFVSPTQVVSSTMDRRIRIWRYSEEPEGFSASLTPMLDLYGHRESIDSIAVHHPSSRILSASADHSVGLWSTKESDSPAAPAKLLPSATSQKSKRRKLAPSTSLVQRGPLTLMKSHSGPVSDTIFDPSDPTVAYSTSWDHTLRTWDLHTSALVDTRTTPHALFSLTMLPSLNLIAAGSSARYITLIDPRVSATTTSAMTLRGHINAVVALARSPESAYGLLSGSHDGTCRIWDVRSSRSEKDGRVGESMYTIPRQSLKEAGKEGMMPEGGEGVKVFGVAWDKEIGIVSVGEDKRVQINRGKGMVQQGQGEGVVSMS